MFSPAPLLMSTCQLQTVVLWKICHPPVMFLIVPCLCRTVSSTPGSSERVPGISFTPHRRLLALKMVFLLWGSSQISVNTLQYLFGAHWYFCRQLPAGTATGLQRFFLLGRLPTIADYSQRHFLGGIGDHSEFRRSRSRGSHSRSRSPNIPHCGSLVDDPCSPRRHSPGHCSCSRSSPRSSVGQDFDLMNPGTTSMFHRRKVVISEMSNILQFPSPSPKEAPCLSFCRGSA